MARWWNAEGEMPLRSANGAHLIATPTRPPWYPVNERKERLIMPGKRWKLAISSDCWHCSECRREIPPETEFYLLDDNKGVARCGQCQREHEIRRENSRRIDALTAHQHRDALLALNRERKITLKHREMLSIQCPGAPPQAECGSIGTQGPARWSRRRERTVRKTRTSPWDRLPLLEATPSSVRRRQVDRSD